MSSSPAITLTKHSLAILAGFAGAYFLRRMTAQLGHKTDICILAPNPNAQLHVLKKERCIDKYCSYATYCWVIEQIDSACHNLDVMMYFLTYAGFTDAFIRAKERGVRVRFVLQYDKNDEGSEWLRLRRKHIPIRMMNVPPSQLMHVKMMIIDHSIAVFGSLNLTFSGLTENHEELVRTDEAHVVDTCIEYFNKNWSLISENDAFHVQCRSSPRGDHG